jgi:RHS repeat-associated protein
MVVERAYAPFGETYNQFGSSTKGTSFTGDLQDIVAGTYDTLNREQNPAQGRWLSVDPAHASWNGYMYSTQPLNTIDPSGLRGEAYVWSQHGRCDPGGPAGQGRLQAQELPRWYNDEVIAAYNKQQLASIVTAVNNLPASTRQLPGISSTVLGPSDPASVRIDGFQFEYNGPAPGFGLPPGSVVDVNVWLEHVVDANGNPVQGDFQVNEQIQEMGSLNLTSPTTAGPPWQGGTIVDNIGFSNPSGTVAEWTQQTFTVTYPNGTTIPLSTVINQFRIYESGVLKVANPAIAIP